MKPHILFVFVLIFITFLRVAFFVVEKKDYTSGERIEFESLVFDSRDYINYRHLTLHLPTGESVYVTTEQDYEYLENIRVFGTLEREVIGDNRQIFTMDKPSIEANLRENNMFLAVISNIRQKIIEFFNSSLDINSSSLILGIVFGIRDTMPKEFSDKLSTTGLLHVVAASGMNVAILAGVVYSFLAFFLKRKTAIILSISAIVFYCFLSGLEPSIIRASIMGSIALIARLTGRKEYALTSLAIAASLMLLASPSLIFNIGFQLSFLATMGLIYVLPLFERAPMIGKYAKNPILETLLVTLSAQIATLPILLSNFGSFSLISVPANMLVLWSVPFIMILGALAAVFGLIANFIGVFLLYLTLPFVFYFRLVVDTIYTDFLSINLTLALPFVLSYYCLLSSLILFTERRKWTNEL